MVNYMILSVVFVHIHLDVRINRHLSIVIQISIDFNYVNIELTFYNFINVDIFLVNIIFDTYIIKIYLFKL